MTQIDKACLQIWGFLQLEANYICISGIWQMYEHKLTEGKKPVCETPFVFNNMQSINYT